MISPDSITSQHILTPRRVATLMQVGAYVRQTADAQMITDHVWDTLCLRLTAYVLTDTQVSETQDVELAVPATWWQHFKQGTWLGNKIARYRPIRLKIMKQRVTFERVRGYPMADVAPPERFGAPIVYDTFTGGGWLAES